MTALLYERQIRIFGYPKFAEPSRYRIRETPSLPFLPALVCQHCDSFSCRSPFATRVRLPWELSASRRRPAFSFHLGKLFRTSGYILSRAREEAALEGRSPGPTSQSPNFSIVMKVMSSVCGSPLVKSSIAFSTDVSIALPPDGPSLPIISSSLAVPNIWSFWLSASVRPSE